MAEGSYFGIYVAYLTAGAFVDVEFAGVAHFRVGRGKPCIGHIFLDFGRLFHKVLPYPGFLM